MRTRILALAVVCGALALAGPAAAPLAGQAAEQQQQQPAQPSMEEMMQEMAKLATPGDHHKHLEQFVGSWRTAGKFWTSPDAAPMESTGEAEHKPVLGGRFIELTYKGVMMEMPFEGMGFIGYDNYAQKHIDFWIDNFGTLMLTGEGSCDASGKTVTMFTTADDPISKTRKTLRSVYTFSGNQYTLEMFDTGPDGKEFRSLEIIHTRK